MTSNQPNFKSRTMWTGDNLDVLRGINSDCIDLIYLDPPFNSDKTYSAPIGSEAAGASFKDTWTLSDVKEAEAGEIAELSPQAYAVIEAAGAAHGKSMKAYVIMMASRLLEMKRVLKPTGSIYLHCDPTANAYLRLLMDAVFGSDSFRNEIAWCYTGPQRASKHFPRKHDTLLFYSGPSSTFNKDDIRIDSKWNALGGFSKDNVERTNKGKVPEDWWHMTFGPNTKERIGYPTQKPLALLKRIIKASSNKGDLVLDPFCGCATACVAAEDLQRQWIGVDLSPLAAKLVKSRLENEFKMFAEITNLTTLPIRTDVGKLPHYKTHKHTLFGKQEGFCGGCKTAFPFRNFTTDHIVPQSKGGGDHMENLQLLCGACNSAKGTGTQAELIAKLKQDGIL